MKPLGEYPTSEEMQADWIHDPEFLRLSSDETNGLSKRTKSIAWMKKQWVDAHAHAASQAGATSEDLVGKARDIITKVLEMGVGSKTNIPGRLTASAIESLLPDDATQLAIDLAMMASGPEAVAGKAAYRILKPAIAGAVGGAMNGSPGEGALRGASEALSGEIGMGAARGLAYALRKRALPSLDFQRLSGWLEQRFGKKIPDLAALRKQVYEGHLVKDMEDAFNKAHARTNKALGRNFRIQAPVIQNTKTNEFDLVSPIGAKIVVPMPLDEVTNKLHILEQAGWNLRGEPLMTHAGAAARDAAHEVEGDIAEQIGNTDPEAGIDWYTAHGQMKEARAMRNLFTEDGAMNENGKPNFTLLQQLVDKDSPDSHRYDLIQGMGDDGHKSFRDMLFRGAPEGSLGDRPGRGPLMGLRVSGHGGFYAHPALPYPARHVGDVPYSLGEGRALRALMTIGPYSMINNLSEMHQAIPPMHITKTPAEAAKPAESLPPTSIAPAS